MVWFGWVFYGMRLQRQGDNKEVGFPPTSHFLVNVRQKTQIPWVLLPSALASLNPLLKWSSHMSISGKIHECLSCDTNQSRSPATDFSFSEADLSTQHVLCLHGSAQSWQTFSVAPSSQCYVQLKPKGPLAVKEFSEMDHYILSR